jgi:hypothetical protein
VLGALVFAACCLRIYDTLVKIITDNRIRNALNKLLQWVYKDENNNDIAWNQAQYRSRIIWRWLLVGFAIGMVVGIGITATVATAGLWWNGIEQGARLIPVLQRAATWIRNVLVPITSLSQLLYVVQNSLQTLVNIFSAKITNPLTAIKNKVHELQEEGENNWQIWNPFRIGSIFLLETCIYIAYACHVIMEAFIGGYGGPAAVSINAVNNTMTDGSQIFEAEEEGHHHGSFIMEAFVVLPVRIALLPIFFLSVLWHRVASKEPVASSFFSDLAESIGIKEVKQNLGISKPIAECDTPEPPVSNECRKLDIDHTCERLQKHLPSSTLLHEITQMKEEAKVLIDLPREDNCIIVPEQHKEKYNTFNERLLFFKASKNPKEQKFARCMQEIVLPHPVEDGRRAACAA